MYFNTHTSPHIPCYNPMELAGEGRACVSYKDLWWLGSWSTLITWLNTLDCLTHSSAIITWHIATGISIHCLHFLASLMNTLQNVLFAKFSANLPLIDFILRPQSIISWKVLRYFSCTLLMHPYSCWKSILLYYYCCHAYWWPHEFMDK